MFEIILYIALVLLALVGIVDILHHISSSFLAARTSGRQILLIMLQDEEAEIALRQGLGKMRLLGSRNCELVAVDCNLSDEMRQICCKLCEDSKGIVMCTKEELPFLLDQEKVKVAV